MTAALQEYQFELEDIVFGLDAPMCTIEGSFSPGSPDQRLNDAAIEGGDGLRPGAELLGVASWSWQLFADGQTSAEALAHIARLRAVWPTEALRAQPDVLVPLRYNLGERVRRVYGRPRRWTPTTNNGLLSGTAGVACDFTVFDHRYYDDAEQSASVDILPAQRNSGVRVPFVPPFTSRAAVGPRSTTITVEGDTPTPAIITFEGPVLKPRLTVLLNPDEDGNPADRWIAEIPSLVASGDPVTVDARPWVRTVTRKSGGGVRTSPRITKIDQLLLPPGRHELVFTGEDPSGEATVTVKWRNAHASL